MQFSRRVFGGAPDSFKIYAEYGSPAIECPQQLRFLNTLELLIPSGSSQRDMMKPLPSAAPVSASLEFEFNSDESEGTVLERYLQKMSSLLHDRTEQRVIVKIVPSAVAYALVWSNNGAPSPTERRVVALQLSYESKLPVLRCLQFYRISSSGIPPDALLTNLLTHFELRGVWKLKSG